MKWFSQNNLISVLRTLRKRQETFSSAVNKTFEEVYDNLEYLDGLLNAFEYSEEDESLTIPIAFGTVADETLILSNKKE